MANWVLAFAGRIIEVSARLARNLAGQHVASQVVEAGPSAGVHYEKARGTGSKADFVHKLGIARMEWWRHGTG